MSIGLTFQQYFMRVPLFDRRSKRAAPIDVALLSFYVLQILLFMLKDVQQHSRKCYIENYVDRICLAQEHCPYQHADEPYSSHFSHLQKLLRLSPAPNLQENSEGIEQHGHEYPQPYDPSFGPHLDQ